MVTRQDSPHSPEIARPPLAAEIIFDGTKLAIEPSRPKTTTDGRICSFQLYSITQNRARRSLTFASSARSIDLRRPHQRADQRNQLREVGHYLSLSAWQIEPVPNTGLPCQRAGVVVLSSPSSMESGLAKP